MALSLNDGGLVMGDDALPLNADINVTPFIDVMLVLLIIFMVAAPLATVDVKVDLPDAAARAATVPEPTVTLAIQADGRMQLGSEAVTSETLGAALKAQTSGDTSRRVNLRADRSLTYDTVMHAMDALRRAGYRHVALVGAERVQP